MRRREFIKLIGGAAAVWPVVGRAQESGRIYRLGVLTGAARASSRIVGFFDELKTLGFVEGRNLDIVVDGFELRDDQFAKVAVTLTKAAPDAVVCVSAAAARAAQEAVHTTPIVVMSPDLVAEGLAHSLSRPGGNITGVSTFSHPISTVNGKKSSWMPCPDRGAWRCWQTRPSPNQRSCRRFRTPLVRVESISQPLQPARLIRSHRRWTRPRRLGPLH